MPGLRRQGQSIGDARGVGFTATADGDGYWVLDSVGGIFAFGSADFFGSVPGLRRQGQSIGDAASLDLVPATDAQGYWILDSVGGIFSFGTTRFFGSAPGRGVGFEPTAVAARPDGDGYWMVDATGTLLAFGSAEPHGAASIPGSGQPPPYPDPDGGYELLPLGDDTLGRWPPCAPIRYVVQRDPGTPEPVLELLQRAARKVTAGTGIPLVLDGFTDERLSDDRPLVQEGRYGERVAPVLVSFEEPDSNNPFDEEGTILGIARPTGRLGVILTGQIGINLDGQSFDFRDEDDEFDTRIVESTLMHELGHAVGLGHAPAADQVMTAGDKADEIEDFVRVEFEDGDRRGLRRVGRTAACPA